MDEVEQEAVPAVETKPAVKKTGKKPAASKPDETGDEKETTLKKAGHATTVETKFE